MNNTRISTDFSTWNFTPLSQQTGLYQAPSNPSVPLREEVLCEREKVNAQREQSLSQRELYLSQRDRDLDQKERIFIQREKAFGQKEESLKQREHEIAAKEEAFNQKSFQKEEAFKQREQGFAHIEEIFQQRNFTFDKKEQGFKEKESLLIQEEAAFNKKKKNSLSVQEHALRQKESLVERKLKALNDKEKTFNDKESEFKAALILEEIEALSRDLYQREALLNQREKSLLQQLLPSADLRNDFLNPSYLNEEQSDSMEYAQAKPFDQEQVNDPMLIDAETERLFDALFATSSNENNSNSWEEENLDEKQSDSRNTTPLPAPISATSEASIKLKFSSNVASNLEVISIKTKNSPKKTSKPALQGQITIKNLVAVKKTPSNQSSLIKKLSPKASNRSKIKGTPVNPSLPTPTVKKNKYLPSKMIVDLAKYLVSIESKYPNWRSSKFEIKMENHMKAGFQGLTWEEFGSHLDIEARTLSHSVEERAKIKALHTELFGQAHQ